MLLATCLDECPDELEADLLSVYHIDIADMWLGHIPYTRIARLTNQLPPGSRIWAELGSDNAWTTEAHLLALQVDILQAGNYQRSGGKGQKPKPLIRPVEAKQKSDEATKKRLQAEEMQRRMEAKTRAALTSN